MSETLCRFLSKTFGCLGVVLAVLALAAAPTQPVWADDGFGGGGKTRASKCPNPSTNNCNKGQATHAECIIDTCENANNYCDCKFNFSESSCACP